MIFLMLLLGFGVIAVVHLLAVYVSERRRARGWERPWSDDWGRR